VTVATPAHIVTALLLSSQLSIKGGNATRFLKPQELFSSYPEVRWAALIKETGEVPFSVMRQGVESLVPENDITGFMEADRGRSILKTAQGLAEWAGKVEGALIRYEKVFLYVIQLESEVMALSIDRATSFERIAQIAKSILSELELQ
jgi:hypothetical protein